MTLLCVSARKRLGGLLRAFEFRRVNRGDVRVFQMSRAAIRRAPRRRAKDRDLSHRRPPFSA